MKSDYKALEDQFYDTASLCFSQLKLAEDNLNQARSSVQRLFSIQTSMAKLRSGKNNTGRAAFQKALKAMLFFLFTPILHAADYPYLVKTNLASMLGDAVQWRSCMEPEEYRVVSTNWTLALPSITSTNGVSTYYEVGTIITNVTLRFTWRGKVCVCPYNQDIGPIVGTRPTTIPALLPNPVLQRSKK